MEDSISALSVEDLHLFAAFLMEGLHGFRHCQWKICVYFGQYNKDVCMASNGIRISLVFGESASIIICSDGFSIQVF